MCFSHHGSHTLAGTDLRSQYRTQLVNYAEIFFDLKYLLATKTDATVQLYYYSFLPVLTWHTPLVIDFLYLMECCGTRMSVSLHCQLAALIDRAKYLHGMIININQQVANTINN